MQKLKILLLGITGDLARIKVLPAIGQFSHLHQNDLEVSLTGFSRSEPDKDEIKNILDKNSDGQNVLKNIDYIVDNYDNLDHFNRIIENLEQDEQLIIYLAVPPIVFIPFLESACPLNPANLHIVIEKPFGRSIEEARSLINTASHCTLTRQVHFFDHYMFKSSSILPQECIFELAKLNQKKIKSIEVKALEELGVAGRKGYYDATGATKDMWQHLFSLTNLLGNYSGKKLPWRSFEISKYETGQYASYLNDLELETSSTESYFYLEGKLGGINLRAESGKSLGLKETSIRADYEDGSKIIWNIDKEKYLKIYNPQGELIHDADLSLTKLIDHTNLFNFILQENPSRFVSNDEVICSWITFDKIKEISASPKKYKDGQYPVKWLDNN